MPRKPIRSRKTARPSLSDGMRHFLVTSNYRLRALFPDCPDRLRIFQLAHPSPPARAELRRVWLLFRDDILEQWKAEKRRGRPWAEREFGGPAKAVRI